MWEGKPIMLVAVDDSAPSFYALEWTLEHFFSHAGSDPPFHLIVIHARPLPSTILGIAGPSCAQVLPIMEADLKKAAANIKEKVQEICGKKSMNDVKVEVTEGEPREVMCEAVEKHHATMLIVGSHGYGTMKRVVLGSVSDYCAHHAKCSVMIVKNSKHHM